MQDEPFMRQWNSNHERFSADLDRGLGHLLRRVAQRRERPAKPIGRSYELLEQYRDDRRAGPALSPAAKASLRGLAASVATFVLWITVMVLATPTPGLAAATDAIAVPASACAASPVLA